MIILTSLLDKKVITNTDHVEDSGKPYIVYATRTEDFSGGGTQLWIEDKTGTVLELFYLVHLAKNSIKLADSVSFSAMSGPRMNSLSTYKPCPDCFATNERWAVRPLEGGNGIVTLQSLISKRCLSNPG